MAVRVASSGFVLTAEWAPGSGRSRAACAREGERCLPNHAQMVGLAEVGQVDRLVLAGAEPLGAAAGRERGPEAAAVIEATFTEEPLQGTKAACMAPGQPLPPAAVHGGWI